MGNLYGEIDLTLLGRLVRNHPSLVKKVQFKDGEHQLLNINVNERQQASEKGNTHYIRASVKKEEMVQGVNYYLGDLKVSQYQAEPQRPVKAQRPVDNPQSGGDEDLPF